MLTKKIARNFVWLDCTWLLSITQRITFWNLFYSLYLSWCLIGLFLTIFFFQNWFWKYMLLWSTAYSFMHVHFIVNHIIKIDHDIIYIHWFYLCSTCLEFHKQLCDKLSCCVTGYITLVWLFPEFYPFELGIYIYNNNFFSQEEISFFIFLSYFCLPYCVQYLISWVLLSLVTALVFLQFYMHT